MLRYYLERYPEAVRHLDESRKIDMSLGAKFSFGNDLINEARLLWPIGRYEEAKRALDQAFSIANDPGSGSKQSLAWIYLCNSQIALSQRRLRQASADTLKTQT